MPDRLSIDDVRHVAGLARLRLSDDELERHRGPLSAILDHVAALEALDVEGVEPMAHPAELVNRLDEDEPGPTLAVEQVLAMAPAVEAHYLSVPKVLDGGGP